MSEDNPGQTHYVGDGCDPPHTEPLSDSDLRAEAIATRDAHDPSKQPDNGYERCALCHYTRHPCDAFDMADAVIRLLDRHA